MEVWTPLAPVARKAVVRDMGLPVKEVMEGKEVKDEKTSLTSIISFPASQDLTS